MFLKFKQGAGDRPVFIHIDDIACVEPNTIGSAVYVRGREKPFNVYSTPDDIIAATRTPVCDLTADRKGEAPAAHLQLVGRLGQRA